MTPVRPGDFLLGKYQVERVLGQGGMGVVVAARHIHLGELFAIKFLLPAALDNAQAFERFLREARAAARLKGEHVAKVQDVGQLENGAPYMVMEYLDGTDLQAILRNQGALPAQHAVMYVLQACDAIAEAHAAGIIHRDLKPANLFLIRRPNGSSCVKVLDFGISKHTAPEDVELTKTGMMLGSPLYMSPEQMARTKRVDARSDVWSMGVVLYELVTGRVPFPGQTITEVVTRVIQEEPPGPSQLRPGIPPALDAIIARCLRKFPEERFQSMGELIQALQGLFSPGWAATAALEPPAAAAGVMANARASMASSPDAYAGPGASTGPGASIGPGVSTGPGAISASMPVQSTGAAWGQTGSGSRPSSGAKLAIVLGSLATLAAVGAGVWFGFGRSMEPSTSLEATSAAPAAAESPAASATGLPSPVEPAAPAIATGTPGAAGTAATEATAAPEPSAPDKPQPPAIVTTAPASRPQPPAPSAGATAGARPGAPNKKPATATTVVPRLGRD